MKTLQFKTNINCGNCVNGVSSSLNEVEAIKKWAVDTNTPDKILTVEGDSITNQLIIDAVEDAGFDISAIG